MGALFFIILDAAAIQQPLVGLVASVLFVGIFSTIIGYLNVALALRRRKHRK